MSWYCVILEGTGIAIPYGEGRTSNRFIATRAVKSASPDEAVAKAKQLVATGWTEPRFAPWNAKASPELSAKDVRSISWWEAWKLRKKARFYLFV